MTNVLYVDPVGGAAGDMLLAALLDAGAPEAAVTSAVDAVLPGRYRVTTEQVRRAGLRSRQLVIEAVAPVGSSRRRGFGELRGIVAGAALSDGVRDRALLVLERLAEAESRVHGVDADDVALHQLGQDDTLIDVVGVVAALDALGIDRMEVGPLPLGSGSVAAGHHGELPLPAPATIELLSGFHVRDGGRGETVTPTAAAVFAALAAPVEGFASMTIRSIGYGAGTRDVADRPNVVRVVFGERTEGSDDDDVPPPRDLVVLEANIDDLTPELMADAAQALLRAGALDAWITPVTMKKGRPGFVLSALAEDASVDRLNRLFFEHTTTFGVRATTVRRTELDRRIETVEVHGEAVRVKVGLLRGHVVSAVPEHDDVAEVAARTGRSVRLVYDEAMAAARALVMAPEGRG